MLFLIGQVARGAIEREAFQEVDFRRMFGQLAKWVAQIDDAARIPELVSHAFHTATAGRPGPVVLALPEDMLTERADVPDVPRYRAVQPHPAPADVADAAGAAGARGAAVRARGRRRRGRRRPPTTCGSGRRPTGLPVGASFRCQDYLDNRSPSLRRRRRPRHQPGAGRARARGRPAARVGARLGESTTSGYTLVDVPVPRQDLRARARRPRGARPRLRAGARRSARRGPRSSPPLRAGPPVAGADLGRRDRRGARGVRGLAGADGPARRREPRRRSSRGWPRPCRTTPSSPTAPATTPSGCTASTATGASARSSGRRPARWATGCPAAVAAKAVHPDRTVVAFAGDGCFLMAASELATAVQHELPIVVVVVDNGMYGTIRMHQERALPRARRRHRPRQPGLRRAGPGLRGPRRDDRAHRGVPGGVRAGRRQRPPGAARAARRPRGADARGDALGDPRAGPRSGPPDISSGRGLTKLTGQFRRSKVEHVRGGGTGWGRSLPGSRGRGRWCRGSEGAVARYV